jgi:hypothetical protein
VKFNYRESGSKGVAAAVQVKISTIKKCFSRYGVNLHMKKATFFILALCLSLKVFAKDDCDLITAWSSSNTPYTYFYSCYWPNLNIGTGDTAQVHFTVYCDGPPPYWTPIRWYVVDSSNVTYTASDGEYHLLPGEYRIYDNTIPNWPLGHFQVVDTSSTLNVTEPLRPAISFYPNPFKENLIIQSGNPNSTLDVKLMNLSGQETGNYQLSGDTEYQLLIGDLAKGIYIIEIPTTDAVIVHKVVKE